MKNPWLRLPQAPPYVYALDEEPIQNLYSSSDPKEKLHLECFPEPYLGRVDAPVVLLGLKPGFDEGDPAAHRDTAFAAAASKSLRHEALPYPLYLLDPSFASTPGGVYYRGAMRELAEALGAGPGKGLDHPAWKTIANEVFVINFFPYHSVEASLNQKPLTSQQYGFSLAHQALARNALVVILLGEAWWKKPIPELAKHARVFIGSNMRSWFLSPGNLPGGFDAVVQELGSRLSNHGGG